MRSTKSRAARICRPQKQTRRLAASAQNELTNLSVVIVVVKVIVLIVEHCAAMLCGCRRREG
jgi:hypothetical protein